MSQPTFFEPSVTPIRNIEAMLREAQKFKNSESQAPIYFRGHADISWHLVPSIGRRDFYKHAGRKIATFSLEQEKQFLHRFRRYAHAYLGRTPDEWEALFIARHHGLPVRLLDWSSNPVVALYNAVNAEPHKDGAIWAILRKGDPGAHHDFLQAPETSPFEVKGVKMIYPIYITPRLNAQSGFFSIHGEPIKPLENYARGHQDFDFLRLKRWVVPSSVKTTLIDDLSRLSINEQTLYPDLDGLARGLWQTEVLRAIEL